MKRTARPITTRPLALLALLAAPAWAAEPEPLAIGAPAPDFSLPATDGMSYTLADFDFALPPELIAMLELGGRS